MLAMALTAPAAGQATSRASVDSGGAQGDEDSGLASISPDGRYVAFTSEATNLVGSDTNGKLDVFVHDSESGTTERVSVDSGGVQGNGHSDYPSISADGRHVAFASKAANLVSGDTNVHLDVFVHDRQSGSTERVSVSSSGTQGNGGSGNPSITPDGRYVTFQSVANNLVVGDTNGMADVFVHDRQNALTERVSVDSGGAQGNGFSFSPSISADGRYVAFESEATNLVGGDTNGSEDIFVHDRQSGTTERVSVKSSGAQANGWSYRPSISADGRYVTFEATASNLVGADTNHVQDIFVRDRQAGTTERVSVSSGGVQGDLHSYLPSISADGRCVAFESEATNFVDGDTNDRNDIFVHDRQSGTTERVSVSSAGAQGNDHSRDPSLSATGRQLAFQSEARTLVSGDTNHLEDIFVRDRAEIGTKYCTANANSTGSPADLSAAGSASSGADHLVLTSMPVPNQSGIFFHGTNQAQIAFGNGLLCTTGGIARGAIVMSVGNVATYTYDNSDARHGLSAFIGSTRNFQHWFRDPAGGGAFFNTSNAMSIAVAP